MALMLDEELDENVTTIKVIGVGGGGGNAVNRDVYKRQDKGQHLVFLLYKTLGLGQDDQVALVADRLERCV